MSANARMTTGPCHIYSKMDMTNRYQPDTASHPPKEKPMNNIVWIVGAVVIVLFVLSVLGLR